MLCGAFTITGCGGSGKSEETPAPAPSGVSTPTPTPTPVPITISVTPSSPRISTGAQQPFTASVTGLDDSSVDWTVENAPSAGTIDASGLYAAPTIAGDYQVTARSKQQSSLSATVIVRVRSGGAGVVLQ